MYKIALKANRPHELPAYLSGKVKKITPQGDASTITLKSFNGQVFSISFATTSRQDSFDINDVVIFTDLQQKPMSALDRFMGKKNTNPVIAGKCGILVTAQEREFLSANKESALVIARPTHTDDLGHETAVMCEPIHGQPAHIRYFKGSTRYTPSIGRPFIAAVTNNNGHQYISIGSERCIPLAADIAPHVFC